MIPALPNRALYAAFDRFPSRKGSAVHIDRFARAAFERFGGGLLYVLGGEGLPPYQREDDGVEIVRFSGDTPHFLPRALHYGARLDALLDVLETYIGRIRPGHSEARRNEVKRHLNHTYFAWMGGTDEDGVFYYRIHSPVILIEFDHQRGIAFDNDAPSRHHIHTVVRTPNGNDYGRDLLRQHHARFDHTRADHSH